MYLKYGSYQHANNEVSVVIDRQAILSSDGIVQSVRHRWNIEGMLFAADTTALAAAQAALEAAYRLHGQDLVLYTDTGAVYHALYNDSTIGGTRVVSPVNYPRGRGAEGGTYRSYTVTVEAEVLEAPASIVSWRETLEFVGGGPVFGFLNTINGPPQKQLLAQQTTYHVTQAGSAVGSTGYPPIPLPLWPADELVHQRKGNKGTPQRRGKYTAAQFIEYPVSWSYSFESVSPLFGNPTLPPV